MATKKQTTRTPAKPMIHSGPPEGVPMPKGIDALPEANEAIRFMSAEHNRQATKRSIENYAQAAAEKARQYRQVGTPELEELPEATGEKHRGRPVFQSEDGRYWLLIGVGGMPGNAAGPLPPRTEAVTYAEVEIEGHRLTDVLEWYEMSAEDVAAMRARDEKEAAVKAEADAADMVIRKLIATAPKHVQTVGADLTYSNIEPSLDTAERLVEETGAKIVITGSGTLLVHAPRGPELLNLVPDDAPRFTKKRLGGHDVKVRALVTVLEQLGPLAVAWVRIGKRPASDIDGKLPANTLGPMGAFLP